MDWFSDADFPADPYPGAVPDGSFVHQDRVGHRLHPDPTRLAGWRIGERDLDDWLAERGEPSMAGRIPVLAYGSNRCPAKITWLREQLGLTGPVVVLAATVEDVAAVWTAGLRVRDGQRPAVLAAAPGARERHCVWLATLEQVAVLDRCEGRCERYRLARLRSGRVRTADGAVIDRPWCYLAQGDHRKPLLVHGAPVRCRHLGQREARELAGVPSASDGLAADTVSGAPHPDEWPAALFSYGLLRTGRAGWPLVAPHADGQSDAAWARGRVYDTGLGWPAMLLGEQPTVRGTLTRLRRPETLMPTLDDYEGPQYRRVRILLPDSGTVSWAYVWVGDRARLRPEGPDGVFDTANARHSN
jgi:gamma-glutamylcyclotransferase (GGCT)/AIG2-like uncharacterized protein YtfP